jgi:cyclic pyranopterin phosphate synthase
MPAEGVALGPSEALLSFEEMARLVRVLARHGVRRVRLTGGEPLVRRELPSLVAMLREVEGIEEVVMTTNGFLLPRYARALAAAGLTGVTVSLDSLRPERFAQLTRRGELGGVLAGIEAAQEAGLGPVKLNAVVIRGFNDDELIELVSWSLSRGCVMRLIEVMPIGEETIWGDLPRGGCVPQAELLAILGAFWRLRPEGVRAGAGPARYWSLEGAGAPEGAKVGIISAVTECFCAGCNRVRLTPQGGLRACLADDREVGLRELLRAGADDEALAAAIQGALWGKRATHSFDIEGGAVTWKQMVSIGG